MCIYTRLHMMYECTNGGWSLLVEVDDSVGGKLGDGANSPATADARLRLRRIEATHVVLPGLRLVLLRTEAALALRGWCSRERCPAAVAVAVVVVYEACEHGKVEGEREEEEVAPQAMASGFALATEPIIILDSLPPPLIHFPPSPHLFVYVGVSRSQSLDIGG